LTINTLCNRDTYLTPTHIYSSNYRYKMS